MFTNFGEEHPNQTANVINHCCMSLAFYSEKHLHRFLHEKSLGCMSPAFYGEKHRV